MRFPSSVAAATWMCTASEAVSAQQEVYSYNQLTFRAKWSEFHTLPVGFPLGKSNMGAAWR